MPHYDFIDTKTKEPVELYFSMSEAPRIGDVVRRDGRRLRRVLSPPPEAHAAREVAFKCWQISGDEAKGARHHDPADGCPVFTSKRDIQEFLRAKHEAGVTEATYGDGWDSVKP